jgi:hypothetical protein
MEAEKQLFIASVRANPYRWFFYGLIEGLNGNSRFKKHKFN